MRLVWLTAALATWLAPALAQERFPTDKTVVLADDGKHWCVSGRQKIAAGVAVTSLRAAQISGLDAESVIEVDGSLTLNAVKGGTVVLENVWIELGPDAKELHLALCEFRGGGVRPSARGATSAKVTCENVFFDEKSACSYSLAAGSLDVYSTIFRQALVIRGAPQSDKAGNKSSVLLRGCQGGPGLRGGVIVEGIADVLVQHCELIGDKSRFTDWSRLAFDGNYVHSTLAQFEQTVFGRFHTADIRNCDFGGDKVEFRCPAKDGKAEKLALEHCWFRGMTEPATICKSMLLEHTSDAALGVEVVLKRVCDAPLGLGGEVH